MRRRWHIGNARRKWRCHALAGHETTNESCEQPDDQHARRDTSARGRLLGLVGQCAFGLNLVGTQWQIDVARRLDRIISGVELETVPGQWRNSSRVEVGTVRTADRPLNYWLDWGR